VVEQYEEKVKQFVKRMQQRTEEEEEEKKNEINLNTCILCRLYIELLAHCHSLDLTEFWCLRLGESYILEGYLACLLF
jgi:hypothetical protein